MNTRSKSKARKNSNSSEDLETDDAVTLGSILNQLENTEDPFEGYPSIENRNINNPISNIISTEEQETEVYHIESTLGSRIVAEIPDIQSIMDSIDAIKDDWTQREKAIPKDLKTLSKELDEFNDVLDEYAENGDIDSVKIAWNTKIKSAYNVVKKHLGEIAEYDEDILQEDSDGKKIDLERKKAMSNIEKVKIKYECANGVYRQTIMSNRQNVEKNSNTKPETVPFQVFNPETVNYVKWDKDFGSLSRI